MRKLAVILTRSAFVLVAFASTGIAGDHAYVGVKTCGMCHKKEADGDQLGKWKSIAHDKAYETLASDEANAAATEAGLEVNPQE